MRRNESVSSTDTLVGSAGGFVANAMRLRGFNAAALRTNDVLRKEEWLQFDQTVVEIARTRLRGIADLEAAGLTYPLANAMGTTIVEWERSSDLDPAQRSMDGVTRGARDRMEWDMASLPVYITHRDFHISLRNLESSRKLGQPLDTTQAAVAARRVADSMEESLFLGSSVTSGGATAYGYTNFPGRVTGTLNSAWDSGAADQGDKIVQDVLAMITAAHGQNMFGPYVLYIPTSYGVAIENDYKAASDRTIVERVRAIEGISDIRVSDVLPADNVLLIQMTSDVVDLVDGEDTQTVQWDSEGGFLLHFKVMAIKVPRLKDDFNGQCGILHYTV